MVPGMICSKCGKEAKPSYTYLGNPNVFCESCFYKQEPGKTPNIRFLPL